MKLLYTFLVYIFLLTTVQAQDIEAILGGSTSSEGFSVIDVDEGTTLFRVRGDGNVGIGTTTPGFKLELNGDIFINDLTNDANLRLYGNGGALWIIGSISSVVGPAGILLFEDRTNDIDVLALQNSTGNVGIGTTAPFYSLTVEKDLGVTTGEHFFASFSIPGGDGQTTIGYRANGSTITRSIVRAGENLPFDLGTTGSPQAVSILNNGNVGIGTTSPNSPDGFTRFLNIEGSGNSALELSVYNFPTTKWTLGMTSSYFSIRRNGTAHMGILNNGNVGIGTINPTAKVDVNGSTGYDQLRMRTSYTPTSSSDTNGNTGDIAWDDNFIYIKTSAGWKRAALSTWP